MRGRALGFDFEALDIEAEEDIEEAKIMPQERVSFSEAVEIATITTQERISPRIVFMRTVPQDVEEILEQVVKTEEVMEIAKVIPRSVVGETTEQIVNAPLAPAVPSPTVVTATTTANDNTNNYNSSNEYPTIQQATAIFKPKQHNIHTKPITKISQKTAKSNRNKQFNVGEL